MTGFVWLAVLGGAAFAALWLLRVPRTLWSMAGAALMLGAIGYAWQGRPALPGAPVTAGQAAGELDPGLVQLRDQMVGSYSVDHAYLVWSDAMLRAGDPAAAAKVLLGGARAIPRSYILWMGLGDALVAHDGNLVSPAALLAYRRAIQLAPQHPAPYFFLGLSYVRAGQFALAAPLWRRALALSPSGAPYRPPIAERLELLERYLALQASASTPAQAGPQ